MDSREAITIDVVFQDIHVLTVCGKERGRMADHSRSRRNPSVSADVREANGKIGRARIACDANFWLGYHSFAFRFGLCSVQGGRLPNVPE
jgi:hypothetical protein